MADQKYQRKLSAILIADVAGYSLLMRDDEAATVRTITAYRKALAQLAQQYRGRVVVSPGDNILAEFTRVVVYAVYVDQCVSQTIAALLSSRTILRLLVSELI